MELEPDKELTAKILEMFDEWAIKQTFSSEDEKEKCMDAFLYGFVLVSKSNARVNEVIDGLEREWKKSDSSMEETEPPEGSPHNTGKTSLEKTIRCPTCKKSFEVTGEVGPEKRPLRFGCPYCEASVVVQWPVSGIVFIRYSPEER